MSISPTAFRYEGPDADGVAILTLDRPDRLNAITFAVYRELTDAFLALDAEPGVRAAVITGAGRGFCSGGDVEEIISRLLGRDAKALHDFTRMTCDLIAAIRHCRRPVVAALNGVVAGAGAVIASACDIRIASPAARIAFLFPKVGLSGADMGACWLLPRLVGASRAAEILLTGDFVPPEEALRIGLYHRVVPQESVLPEARAWARRLAKGPVTAHGVTKRMLDREASMTLEEALAAEAQEQARLMEHPDFREAYEANRDKREARYE